MSALPHSRPVAAIKRLVADYGRLKLGDAAAALTYYAVLSIFPGMIVLLALIGIFGDEDTGDSLLRIIGDLAPGSAADTFEGATRKLVTGGGAGFALLAGLAAALYSASGYIGAFTRAANSIYEVEETRPFWRNIPRQLALALGLMVMLSLTVLALILTGPLLQSIGAEAGVGDGALTVFKIVKWPVLGMVVVFMFALLQYTAPNVDHRRFRDLLPGSFLAMALWLAVSAGFSVYVSNFGSYAGTYGSLAGVIVFLIWIWLSNLALLVGATFNVELTRTR